MTQAEITQAIIENLRGVIDPETGADVWRMRLVEELVVSEVTLPGCHHCNRLPGRAAAPEGRVSTVESMIAFGPVPFSHEESSAHKRSAGREGTGPRGLCDPRYPAGQDEVTSADSRKPARCK